jgi:UTP--glucose-1-phosphate uridylyltransferase
LPSKPEPDVAPSTLSVIGRYILQPDIFNILEHQQQGRGGEIQLTDAISSMIPDTPMYGFRFDGKRYDCGSNFGFVQANIAFGLEHPESGAPLREFIKELYEDGMEKSL